MKVARPTLNVSATSNHDIWKLCQQYMLNMLNHSKRCFHIKQCYHLQQVRSVSCLFLPRLSLMSCCSQIAVKGDQAHLLSVGYFLSMTYLGEWGYSTWSTTRKLEQYLEYHHKRFRLKASRSYWALICQANTEHLSNREINILSLLSLCGWRFQSLYRLTP